MEETRENIDALRKLLQTANAIGDAYIWGFHWGRPGDGFDKLTGFDYENDVLRLHSGDSSKEIISVYSPRLLRIGKGPQQEAVLEVRDAQRVRFDWLDGPGEKTSFLEFWKMDGDIYGKTNGDWPTNTGMGIGDQSQPALSVSIFQAQPFFFKDVPGKT